MPKIIENLEEKLIEEARQQINRHGYGAVTIRSVAKACGVGVGTVYNYFTSKDELLAAYMLADWTACIAVVARVSEDAETAEPVARCIYEQLRAFVKRHSNVFSDQAAASAFGGSFSRYHALLRSQISDPLRKFCEDDFTSHFVAESLLVWTMAGKEFDEIYGKIRKLL